MCHSQIRLIFLIVPIYFWLLCWSGFLYCDVLLVKIGSIFDFFLEIKKILKSLMWWITYRLWFRPDCNMVESCIAWEPNCTDLLRRHISLNYFVKRYSFLTFTVSSFKFKENFNDITSPFWNNNSVSITSNKIIQ